MIDETYHEEKIPTRVPATTEYQLSDWIPRSGLLMRCSMVLPMADVSTYVISPTHCRSALMFLSIRFTSVIQVSGYADRWVGRPGLPSAERFETPS